MSKDFKEGIYNELANYLVNNYSEEEMHISMYKILEQCLSDIEQMQGNLKIIESKLEMLAKMDEILKEKKLEKLN